MHGRNSLAGLRALGGCVGNEADTEQERSECVVVAEWNTRPERISELLIPPPGDTGGLINITAERRLLTLCREPASDKESQPQRPARRA